VPVIVSMPADIDITNADSIGEQLLAAIAPGMSAVVADLTGTIFCDCSGARSLMLGYRKAVASNTQLLLAVPSRATLPILELLGLRRILRIYPTPAAALAAVAEAAASTTGRVPPPIEQQAGVARLEHQARGPAELRITRVFPCVAHWFKARASFMFAGGCWWRPLAVDGSSGASRGGAPVVRRPGPTRPWSWCTALSPIGLTAAGPFAGGTVSRVASRVRKPGGFTCAHCPAVTAALDAVLEAYHNTAAVWWGGLCTLPRSSRHGLGGHRLTPPAGLSRQRRPR
jgi:anti-anti-sigma factor